MGIEWGYQWDRVGLELDNEWDSSGSEKVELNNEFSFSQNEEDNIVGTYIGGSI